MRPLVSNFRFPTDIRFGAGVRHQLAQQLQAKGSVRPLVVTDAGLKDQPFLAELVEELRAATLEPGVFADAAGNPVKQHVASGVAAYRQARADAVVAVGGGCALDVAKAIALMVHHPGDLFDYEDEKPGARPIDQKIPFIVALPTTAGTGSEVGGSSVISDDDNHAKVIIWSGRLIPNVVLADPELTFNLPAAVTAATGMDALTHNVEAFLAKGFHPICDGIALEGVRLVATSLKQAFSSPHDLDARSNMLLASMMGAIAFQKGLGVTHSCAHALSTCFDTHHGLANAVMISACMRFNAKVCEDRFQRLAQAVGLPAQDGSEGFIAWLDDLKSTLSIPDNLASIGARVEDRLIEVALNDQCHLNNPRPCVSEDFRRIYTEVNGCASPGSL